MNDDHYNSDDMIPVLSDVVIPGNPPVVSDTTPAPPTPLRAERLNALAAVMLAEMEHRIERMVEEELARAHTMAIEIARVSLQNRLRNELEARLATFIDDALNPPHTS